MPKTQQPTKEQILALQKEADDKDDIPLYLLCMSALQGELVALEAVAEALKWVQDQSS